MSEAAYQNVTSTTTVTVEDVTSLFPEAVAFSRNTFNDGSWGLYGAAGFYSDIVLKYNISFSGTYYYDTPYILEGRLFTNLRINKIIGPDSTSPILSQVAARVEIIDTWSEDFKPGVFESMTGENITSNTSSYREFRIYTSFNKESAARTGNSAPVFYQRVRVHYSIPMLNIPSIYANHIPTVTASLNRQSFRIQESADMIPYATQNNAMLQTMNTNVSSINALTTTINNNVTAIRNAITANTVAGDIVEDANQDFVNSAASLEAGQSNLEAAADASLDAVDYNKITLLGTYSQSVSFWGRIISALPTVTAAFWEVLVFGFLIAFLVFILRLVK